MKVLLILLATTGLVASDKLDRTYLPPSGSKFAGGSPGALDLPLEYPKNDYQAIQRTEEKYEPMGNSQGIIPDSRNIFEEPSNIDTAQNLEMPTRFTGAGFNKIQSFQVPQSKPGRVSTLPNYYKQNKNKVNTKSEQDLSRFKEIVPIKISKSSTSYPAQDPSIGTENNIPAKIFGESYYVKPGQYNYRNQDSNTPKRPGLILEIKDQGERTEKYPDTEIRDDQKSFSKSEGPKYEAKVKYQQTMPGINFSDTIPTKSSGKPMYGQKQHFGTTIPFENNMYKDATKYGSQAMYRPDTITPALAMDISQTDLTSTVDSPLLISTSFRKPLFSNINQEVSVANYKRPDRPQAEADRNAVIVNYQNIITPGGFSYSYDTSNGIHADESGTASDGVKAKGSYSYTGDDGIVYSITYTADENGYRPMGDHLPTPPPIPVEIQAALNQLLRNEEAGIFDDGSYDENKYGYEKYLGKMDRYNHRLQDHRRNYTKMVPDIPNKQYESNQATTDRNINQFHPAANIQDPSIPTNRIPGTENYNRNESIHGRYQIKPGNQIANKQNHSIRIKPSDLKGSRPDLKTNNPVYDTQDIIDSPGADGFDNINRQGATSNTIINQDTFERHPISSKINRYLPELLRNKSGSQLEIESPFKSTNSIYQEPSTKQTKFDKDKAYGIERKHEVQNTQTGVTGHPSFQKKPQVTIIPNLNFVEDRTDIPIALTGQVNNKQSGKFNFPSKEYYPSKTYEDSGYNYTPPDNNFKEETVYPTQNTYLTLSPTHYDTTKNEESSSPAFAPKYIDKKITPTDEYSNTNDDNGSKLIYNSQLFEFPMTTVSPYRPQYSEIYDNGRSSNNQKADSSPSQVIADSRAQDFTTPMLSQNIRFDSKITTTKPQYGNNDRPESNSNYINEGIPTTTSRPAYNVETGRPVTYHMQDKSLYEDSNGYTYVKPNSQFDESGKRPQVFFGDSFATKIDSLRRPETSQNVITKSGKPAIADAFGRLVPTERNQLYTTYNEDDYNTLNPNEVITNQDASNKVDDDDNIDKKIQGSPGENSGRFGESIYSDDSKKLKITKYDSFKNKKPTNEGVAILDNQLNKKKYNLTSTPFADLDNFENNNNPSEQYTKNVSDYKSGEPGGSTNYADDDITSYDQKGQDPYMNTNQFDGRTQFGQSIVPNDQKIKTPDHVYFANIDGSKYDDDNRNITPDNQNKVIGEDFSGPKRPQGFDPATGYYYK